MTTQHPLDQFGQRLRESIQHKFPSDDNIFNDLALELFALQFAHNQPFQKLCQHRGLAPDDISSWRKIPAMPTVAFKELRLTSLTPQECTTEFNSSGTTAHRPSRHFHSATSLAVYGASLVASFRWQLMPERGAHAGSVMGGDATLEPPEGRAPLLRNPTVPAVLGNMPILALTPPAIAAPHSSLVHMFQTVIQAFGAPGSGFVGGVDCHGAWTLNAPATLATLQKFESRNQAVLLLGTAFSYVHLLDHLEDEGLALHLTPGSRAMETGGYKGRSRELPKAELHRWISERLGVSPAHIVSEYGMSELSSQAYDSELRGGECGAQSGQRLFHFPAWARVQIISPETGREAKEGETGLIRVFDLANVRSVLAVQTEDHGVRRGDSFELLGRAALAESRGCSLMAT